MTENISQFWENLLNTVSTYLPTVIVSVLILLAGYLLGRLVQRMIRRLILYLNKDMNMRLRGSSMNIDLKGSAKFISAAFFWVILSIAVLASIHVLELDFRNDLFDRAAEFLPNVIAAIIIIFVGIIAGRLLSDLLQSASARAGIANRSFVSAAIRYFIILIAIIIASDQLGIQIKFLTDVIDIVLAMLLFAAALSFGLGAKTSVGNIFGSFYARKDHQIGSRIRYKGFTGTIAKITGHSIHLETDEGIIVIPAKKFNESEVTIIREDDD